MAYPGVGAPGPTATALLSVPYTCMLRARADAPDLTVQFRRAEDADLPALHALLNYEITVSGNSYPLRDPLSFADFRAYYASHDLFVLAVVASSAGLENLPANRAAGFEFGSTIVGSVHVKPNYPGRCAGICNGAFLVVPQFQRRGAGSILGRRFQAVAAELGYRRSVFNLVFTANAPSLRLWDRLGFERVGLIPDAGLLKAEGGDILSDAVVFSFDLRPLRLCSQSPGCVATWDEATALLPMKSSL